MKWREMRVVLLLALTCTAHVWGVDQMEARVRTTAGGPQIFVNGVAVPPRMFWGRSGTGPFLLDETRWTKFSHTFRSETDCACANVHFRFHKVDGGITRLRNVRVTAKGVDMLPDAARAFDSAAAFGSTWKIWPPRNDYVHTCSNGVCEIHLHPWRLPGRDLDYHFYSQFFKLSAQTEYRLEFEAQGASGCAWIVPAVYSVAADGQHTALPLSGRDTLSATAAKAAAAQVDFVSYGIPEVWKEGGDDFAAFDAVTDRILVANPKARLIPRVSVNAPLWWLRKNPDHRMQYAAEHVENGGTKAWGRGLRPDMAAISSRLYQQAAIDYITRFVRHMMVKYPANFAGIHPTGQNTHEWFYFDSWHKMNGYDPQTQAAFRTYLGDPRAEVPTPSERAAHADAQHLLDGATQHRCLAFNRFQQKEMTDFLARLAKACRTATEGRKLVVLFYGYAYEFAAHTYGPANSGHYGLENLLRQAADAIDILCSPISYSDRAWCGSAPNMSCGETVMRHGVLWLNEDDSRTYLDLRTGDYVQEGSRVTKEQSQQVMLRNTAQEAIRGFGSWWMDLPGAGWYNSDALWSVQAALNPLDAEMCRRTRPYEPAVALIQDEESMLHVLPKAAGVNGKLVSNARKEVNRAGVSHGQYLLFDVLEKPLAANLQIFQSCWCLPDVAVEKLVAYKRTHPAWRVWGWAAGAQNEAGTADLVRMGRLNGFELVPHDLKADSRILARATAVGRAKGLKADRWYGTGSRAGLAFAVRDARPEEIWATYPNGDVAIAVRKDAFGGGDIFLGVPELTPEMVHAFAVEAGVHRYLLPDDIGKASVWSASGTAPLATSGVLSVQALTNATVRLQLPTNDAVVDALTGKSVGQGPDLPLTLQQGEVRVLTWKGPSSNPCPTQTNRH